MTKERSFIFIGGKQIGFDCLSVLLKNGLRPKLVIANLDDKGKDTWHKSLVKFSEENNLPLIKNKEIKDKKILDKIRMINPEIIFCFGATQIIPAEILKIPKDGVLNLHPALLPKYRGRYSTVQAIFNNEKKAGVTLHLMDERIDSGPIISQISFPISKSDTAKTVYDKFTKEGTKLFKSFIVNWEKGTKIISKKQDEKKATYFPKELPNNGQIDWNWDGEKIFNFIRSMTFEPFPPPSFMIGNKKMIIIEEKYFKGFK